MTKDKTCKILEHFKLRSASRIFDAFYSKVDPIKFWRTIFFFAHLNISFSDSQVFSVKSPTSI